MCGRVGSLLEERSTVCLRYMHIWSSRLHPFILLLPKQAPTSAPTETPTTVSGLIECCMFYFTQALPAIIGHSWQRQGTSTNRSFFLSLLRQAPSAQPTTEPTSAPSVVPSTVSTRSIAPVRNETAIMAKASYPSIRFLYSSSKKIYPQAPTTPPTTGPTSAPSGIPSAEPSAAPTTTPTVQPSASPSAVPTTVCMCLRFPISTAVGDESLSA